MQKYKAKKVKLDGYHFDSMAEAKHYWFGIKPRLEAGEILDLRLQPSFRCEINGKLICKYLADFQYMQSALLKVTGIISKHGEQSECRDCLGKLRVLESQFLEALNALDSLWMPQSLEAVYSIA